MKEIKNRFWQTEKKSGDGLGVSVSRLFVGKPQMDIILPFI
jgi:hypothetical protein